MTVLRCSAKLLKRLKLPTSLPEPLPQANPLGEWYADIDFWHRRPFVVMLNASTGAVLMLNGNAQGCARCRSARFCNLLPCASSSAFAVLMVDAELHGFHAGFAFGKTRDRSLIASIDQRKFGAWMGFEWNETALIDEAVKQWRDGLFRHPALGRNSRFNSPYHDTLDLIRQRLA
jgi:hypothetical protein